MGFDEDAYKRALARGESEKSAIAGATNGKKNLLIEVGKGKNEFFAKIYDSEKDMVKDFSNPILMDLLADVSLDLEALIMKRELNGKPVKVLTCNVAKDRSFDCDINGKKVELNYIRVHNGFFEHVPFTTAWTKKQLGDVAYKQETARLKAQQDYYKKH